MTFLACLGRGGGKGRSGTDGTGGAETKASFCCAQENSVIKKKKRIPLFVKYFMFILLYHKVKALLLDWLPDKLILS
jgi:hypothetical protein